MEYKKKINGRPEPEKEEKSAADFLTRRGVKILERNFSLPPGEIDPDRNGRTVSGGFVGGKYRKTARNE